MFGLFKKKSEVEKLQEEYAKLMATYHKLSTSNRAASDDAFAKANDIANQIDKLVKK
ncbi:MAG: Lacal_2735 family protein [Nonlabens sp.]|nr:Lacal_2735 family protein [Nonlabens sp.]MDP5101516.1 Lacal_2735 family protein [Nonlabens sp.]